MYLAFASMAIYVSKEGLLDRHTYDMELSKLPLFALVSQMKSPLPMLGADPMI